MHNKSHVSLEQHVCLVCGVRFYTGAILLDKRLRASLQHHTTTGWGLCPEHEQLFKNGYVALVECDPQRSGTPSHADRVKPGEMYRTGQLAHVKREAFARLFSVSITENQACVFVEPDVIAQLQAMTAPK